MDIALINLALNLFNSIRRETRQARSGAFAARLDTLPHKVEDTAGRKLDEAILRTMREAIQLLKDAAIAKDEALRRDQLTLARGRFVQLATLDPSRATVGTSAQVSNAYLNCVGYWGNFYYFMMHGDVLLATRQVYTCSKQHPELSIGIFEEGFFKNLPSEQRELRASRNDWPRRLRYSGIDTLPQLDQHFAECRTLRQRRDVVNSIASWIPFVDDKPDLFDEASCLQYQPHEERYLRRTLEELIAREAAFKQAVSDFSEQCLSEIDELQAKHRKTLKPADLQRLIAVS